MKIVTHKGSAHRDEFMACCLLIAAGKATSIERRDSTTRDLSDAGVLVLDQGGCHEPDFNNYDHHQLPRDADPTCSITLILPLLCIDQVQARDIWRWLEFSERLDSKGPFASAVHYGMSSDALFATVSPIETTVLRWFERQTQIAKSPQGWESDPLWDLMELIGREKLDSWD